MGGYPRKEITNYEITISDHSFNGPHNAIILKILALAQARVKSMVAGVFCIFLTSHKNPIIILK
ncbi:hypothetical protein ID0148_01090 [Helicobacter pylori]